MTMEDTERSGLDEIVERLRSLVPTLPPDLADDLDTPLADRMSHGTFQALVLAAQSIAPHLDRSAVTQANLRDLAAWIEPATAEVPTASARPPRGSYRSASTTLRPLTDDDLPSLYRASLQPQMGHRWRFRGSVPSPEDFRAQLFSRAVIAQFMAVTVEGGTPIGLVSGYDADLNNGHCYVAIQRLDMGDGTSPTRGLMMEGFFVFVQYLFDHFTFNKLYMELPEYNVSLLSGAEGALLHREGELKEHFYYGDRTWSKCFYALYRREWDVVAPAFRGEWREGHFDGYVPPGSP